jgi:hypothetical protein
MVLDLEAEFLVRILYAMFLALREKETTETETSDLQNTRNIKK